MLAGAQPGPGVVSEPRGDGKGASAGLCKEGRWWSRNPQSSEPCENLPMGSPALGGLESSWGARAQMAQRESQDQMARRLALPRKSHT